ncbi:hypothetical protein IZY60_14565 [Lutibacter sp. B2]|nr:hypothetical protein [Lutibacter sp. B2]
MTLDKKEPLKLYLFYFALIIIANITNTISITFVDGKVAFIISIIWMIITIIFYFIIKKNNKGLIVYSFLNAVVSGIAMSAYYSIKSVLPFNSLFFLIVFGFCMFLNYTIINKTQNNELFIRINIITIILILIISNYIWITSSPTVGSGMVFFCIVYLCFNIALLRANNKDTNYTKIVGYASLIMFGGILLAVIVVLSEGDGMEIIDGDWRGKSKKKKIEQ